MDSFHTTPRIEIADLVVCLIGIVRRQGIVALIRGHGPCNDRPSILRPAGAGGGKQQEHKEAHASSLRPDVTLQLDPMKIHVVTTGGTIEKIYSEQTGKLENLTARIDRYLKQLRLPDAQIDVTPLMNKDSLEMTKEDRELVLAVVKAKVGEAAIVITHGTDTMVETGRLLKQRLPDLQHPVVLTGAMTPLGFERSDGLQNLTESLFAARTLLPGVWIVMHGQVFDVDHARKDREQARFMAT